MIFSHEGLEAGGGGALRAALLGAPLDKEAVGQAAKHPQHPQAIIALHPAPVIVVGDVQPLVQSAFVPHPCRLSSSQSIAGNRETGALVIKATSSFLRPWVWRNSRAA
jgi:hypothetical protein